MSFNFVQYSIINVLRFLKFTKPPGSPAPLNASFGTGPHWRFGCPENQRFITMAARSTQVPTVCFTFPHGRIMCGNLRRRNSLESIYCAQKRPLLTLRFSTPKIFPPPSTVFKKFYRNGTPKRQAINIGAMHIFTYCWQT